jgi:hypothetical protein
MRAEITQHKKINSPERLQGILEWKIFYGGSKSLREEAPRENQ